MKLLEKIRSSAFWLMIPSLVVAAFLGVAISSYEPLEIDPNLIGQANAAQGVNLKTIDADEKASDEPPGTPAPEGALQTTAGIVASSGLRDGMWTGYAACGKGNPDGWKPYYVAVTIQVKNGKVVRIVKVEGTSRSDSGGSLSWDASENQAYLTWASSGRAGQTGVTDQLNAKIGASKSISGVDTVSGATYSSVAIYNAYAAAVNKAKGSDSTAKDKKAKKPKKSKKSKKSKKKTSSEDSSKLKDKTLADGSWTGYAACGMDNEEEWNPYYVAVTITVKKGKVTSVSKVVGSSTGESGSSKLNWNKSENQTYLDWAAQGRKRSGTWYEGVANQIEAALASGSYPSSVDVVSGATYSSDAVFKAFYAALKKSAEVGGAEVVEPDDGQGKSQDDSGDTPGGNSQGGSGDGGSYDPSGPDDSGDPDNPDNPDDPSDPGEDQETTRLVDGTYSAYAFCKDLDDPSLFSPYYIVLEIEVAGGKVAQISNVYADSEGTIDPHYKYDSSENSIYLNIAINGVGKKMKGMVAKIQEKLDAGEDTSSVDVVSGATWSSKSIQEAFNKAVASVPEEVIEG